VEHLSREKDRREKSSESCAAASSSGQTGSLHSFAIVFACYSFFLFPTHTGIFGAHFSASTLNFHTDFL